MRAVQLGQDELKMILENAANMGRGGDTQLAHINEDEAKLLKEAGGAGTVNPETGLREYMGGGGGRDSGANSPSGDKGRGVSSGDKGGSKSGGSGERGTPGQQQDKRNQQAARDRGNVAPGVKADDRNRSLSNNSPTDVARAFTNSAKAQKDFAGEDDTFMDKVGNFLAGMFGAGEINPQEQSMENFVGYDTAEWGVDPISAGLALAGMAFPPAKLAHLAYQGVTNMFDVDTPQIGLRGLSGNSFEDAEGKIATASGQRGGMQSATRGGNDNRDPMKGGVGSPGQKQGVRGKTTSNPASTKPTPAGTPATPAEKTPGEILLAKYKLPGINAPFELTPYAMDQTQHNKVVSDFAAGRA